MILATCWRARRSECVTSTATVETWLEQQTETEHFGMDGEKSEDLMNGLARETAVAEERTLAEEGTSMATSRLETNHHSVVAELTVRELLA